MSIVRVVSYNIHKGRSATGNRESLADLKLSLYQLAPDLLFLQEVQGRNELRGTLDAQHESLELLLACSQYMAATLYVSIRIMAMHCFPATLF